MQINKKTTGGGSPWKEDEFTPGAGQTVFNLSTAPTDANSVVFIVNGVIADDGTDYTYTLPETDVTWTNSLFALDDSDKVLIRYQ